MIRVRQIKIPIKRDNDKDIKSIVSSKLRVKSEDILSYSIIKKSIDARDKSNIYYVYELDLNLSCEEDILKKNKSNDVFITPEEVYSFPKSGDKKLNDHIIIVGAGPSGLFCSYLLALNGYHPILIEQGEKIEDRVKTVEKFFQDNILDPLSNVQFGEGGAGTFSDGKLNTLVKDKKFRGKKVFEIFVENGAPKEIMYLQKPHIGTDILREVIINMRKKIIAMGGEILYSSKLTDIIISDGKVCGIEINQDRRISCEVLVLAIGHSARDTFSLLLDKNVSMRQKNFAVGVRIEHPQEMINKSQYGDNYKLLGAASYKLTHTTSNGRGVYSFCMCPGGFVVNASSEKGHLVVNGMSNYLRNEKNSNSAIVVTISSKDFGDGVLAGVEFQRKLEEKAYMLGDGKIPVQLFGDFVNNKKSSSFYNVIPNTKGDYSFANLRELFSDDINSSIQEGIISFGKKIRGFDRADAVLLGVESRTSSPVMIERDENGVSNILGLYPCGEGAGYAGGITTAAMDGIKTAENIAFSYKA